ncbi:MAG: GNAT family N-acetyltransferase [Pseudomonadota bacterium]
MAEYHFTPLTSAHYPMIRDWLAQPHINGWWGDGDTEIALMEQDLEHGPTDMRIVSYKGQPFAYVQDYPAHHWDMPQYADLPSQSRAVDTFLGDPAFLGKGHAAGYLRQRARELARRYPAVAVDPDPANTRAVTTYRRAGFDGTDVRPCEDGDPVLVMTFQAESPA